MMTSTRLLLGLVCLASVFCSALELSTSNEASFARNFLLGNVADSRSGDAVLSRPTVGLMVIVDGEGPSSENEWTPFLKTLHKRQTGTRSVKQVLGEEHVDALKALAGKGFEMGLSALVDEDRDEVFTYYRLTKAGAEPFLTIDEHESSRNHLVVVEKETDRLAAELALVGRLTEQAITSKLVRPGLVVAVIHGLKDRQSTERAQSMNELLVSVEKLFQSMKRQTSRPVLSLVFTEKAQGPAAQAVSEVEAFAAKERRRQLQTTRRQPFQGADYVIMFWVLVFLMFLAFFVLVCIPWAPALDPVLRSSLKQDTKRD